MMDLNELARECHEIAVSKGWYDGPPRQVPELLCLAHSELSEALECYRDGLMYPSTEEDGKPVGFPSEMADVFIRILDACAFLGIDIHKAVATKMAYNRTRTYRHGGKRA